MNLNLKDFLAGLLVTLIGGAVNAAAVAVATGFALDAAHWKAMAAAAVVGGLFNASAYLRQPALQVTMAAPAPPAQVPAQVPAQAQVPTLSKVPAGPQQ